MQSINATRIRNKNRKSFRYREFNDLTAIEKKRKIDKLIIKIFNFYYPKKNNEEGC